MGTFIAALKIKFQDFLNGYFELLCLFYLEIIHTLSIHLKSACQIGDISIIKITDRSFGLAFLGWDKLQ